MDRIPLLGLLAAMFLAGLVEVIFPPFPGDTVFIAGGFIADRRGFSPIWPVLAACLGTFLAGATLFFLGRFLGRPLLDRRFFARLLPETRQERLEWWFGRYGFWLILVSRFVPIVRSGIALFAGIANLRPILGLAGLAGGIVVFNSVYIIGGSLLGEGWRVLAARIGVISWAAVGLAVFAAFIWAILVRRRSR